MELNLQRFDHMPKTTLGMLYIGNKRECYTLEDEYRKVKVKHHTRIPDGSYKVKLRTVGRFHQRYLKRFPKIHKGMLELQDVPNFKYILIHCGNDEGDTSGCILVGSNSVGNRITGSTIAYKKLYYKVIKAIDAGEEVTINIQSVNQ